MEDLDKLKKEIEETVVDLLNYHLNEDEEPKDWSSPAGKSLVDAYTRELLNIFRQREKELLEEFMIYLEKMENIQFPDEYPEGVWSLGTLRKYVESFRKELSNE